MDPTGAVVTRFAPSPTGHLHVGNARTALINWLYARRHGGRFLLRIDDTDPARSRADYARAIEEDLRWLGLDWDDRVRQSDRGARYAAAVERLRAAGRLYPCYETPEELELKRARARTAGRPPIYDRAALTLDEDRRRAYEAERRRPYWRFLLRHESIAWDDLVRGPVSFEGADLSDPVLVREDGQPLYTLTSVVDDLELGVRQVIRGEDHVTNTAAQIQLFQALGGEPPAFAHHSLLAGPGGEKLSKRAGDLSLRTLRERGLEAMAVNSLLARLGTADPVEPRASLAELVEGFDLARFGRAMARFDDAELEGLNARVLQRLPYEAVAGRLEMLGLGPPTLAAMDLDDGAPFWLAVRGNLERLSDAASWLAVCTGPVTPVIEAEGAPVVDAAAALLPKGPFDQDTWRTWTQDVRALSGAKGRALFRPLRLALTGREHGPEMQNLLPLIGPARARARLGGRTA